jgi:thioredoxin-dependent peroxiredoxin
MSLRINSEAPDFIAETTQGTISFHDWIGNSWAILFSHPKDFTPVCTTELGYMAGLKPQFDRRNTKIIGLSVDPVGNHGQWAKDIEETQGHAVTYPMIGDPELTVANATGGRRRYSERPNCRRQCNCAFGLRDRAGQEDQGDAHLSD